MRHPDHCVAEEASKNRQLRLQTSLKAAEDFATQCDRSAEAVEQTTATLQQRLRVQESARRCCYLLAHHGLHC